MIRPALIEFPADDPERARRFWSTLLGSDLAERDTAQGSGWVAEKTAEPGASPPVTAIGVHQRGTGPGDTNALPYFDLDPDDSMDDALSKVTELGGSIGHPGQRWSICRDSEGNPFALAAAPG